MYIGINSVPSSSFRSPYTTLTPIKHNIDVMLTHDSVSSRSAPMKDE
jgi:hypothetical protein